MNCPICKSSKYKQHLTKGYYECPCGFKSDISKNFSKEDFITFAK